MNVKCPEYGKRGCELLYNGVKVGYFPCSFCTGKPKSKQKGSRKSVLELREEMK